MIEASKIQPVRRHRVACAALLALGLLVPGCGSSKSTGAYRSPIFRTPPPPLADGARLPDTSTPRRSVRGGDGWIPNGGIQGRWTDIVIHHSASDAGGAISFDRYHRDVNHWDELGYHFVIGNGTETADGQVEVGPRWRKQKWGAHCKTPGNHFNDHGIGICLVGDFSRQPPSPAQLASLDRLLRFLSGHCSIPVGRIHGHGGITGRTECPGQSFPLAAVKRDLGVSGTALSHASRSVRLH